MIETINNFAGFNLAAILFGSIAGAIFLIIFHYLLMPILSFILINPLASVVVNTLEFFKKKENDNSTTNMNSEKKKAISEKLIGWFSKFFIIKVILFLFVPFIIIIYYFEANEENVNVASFDPVFISEILFGFFIFLAVVLVISLLAKLAKFEFKKTFPIVFIVSFFLGFLDYFK